MGFWHTGYMEFHEDAFFSAVFASAKAPYRHSVIPCPDCGLTFATLQDFELHRFNGHLFVRPTFSFVAANAVAPGSLWPSRQQMATGRRLIPNRPLSMGTRRSLPRWGPS